MKHVDDPELTKPETPQAASVAQNMITRISLICEGIWRKTTILSVGYLNQGSQG